MSCGKASCKGRSCSPATRTDGAAAEYNRGNALASSGREISDVHRLIHGAVPYGIAGIISGESPAETEKTRSARHRHGAPPRWAPCRLNAKPDAIASRQMASRQGMRRYLLWPA